RSTAVCATVFFVCTLALAYAGVGGRAASGGSVLDRATTPAAAASAPAAGAIPGGAPGAPAVPAAPAVVPPAPAASGGAIPTR
ncbi:MAG: preprotein translocase subunit SecG, partial [Comamonadaceae bacterium]|nr:preprotein translocase subunit SecG [Comamonadaceae bacterium]